MPLEVRNQNKQLESDYYVEGYATTFNEPYLLYEHEGVAYYEMIDRHALDDADMSDVIMQYDHCGTVFARNKMGNNQPPSLVLTPKEDGLFIAADLGIIEEGKRLYESIQRGLVYKMSWAFVVDQDHYDRETHTRTILKIKKVYDVSAVSIPANADTDIAARSFFNGVIEKEKRESLVRKKALLLLKTKLED